MVTSGRKQKEESVKKETSTAKSKEKSKGQSKGKSKGKLPIEDSFLDDDGLRISYRLGTSKYAGVVAKGGKWEATFGRVYLGRFDSELEAARARRDAELRAEAMGDQPMRPRGPPRKSVLTEHLLPWRVRMKPKALSTTCGRMVADAGRMMLLAKRAQSACSLVLSDLLESEERARQAAAAAASGVGAADQNEGVSAAKA